MLFFSAFYTALGTGGLVVAAFAFWLLLLPMRYVGWRWIAPGLFADTEHLPPSRMLALIYGALHWPGDPARRTDVGP